MVNIQHLPQADSWALRKLAGTWCDCL